MGSSMGEESSGAGSVWEGGIVAGEDIKDMGGWWRGATAWGVPDMG
jgi:hypothetical protein